jgi:hypothetical protein
MVIGSVRIPTECNVVHCTNLQLIGTAVAHSVNCFSSGAAMAQYVNFAFFWSGNDEVFLISTICSSHLMPLFGYRTN